MAGIFGRSDRRPRVVARGALRSPDGYDALVSVAASSRGLVAVWSSNEGQTGLLGRDEPVTGGGTFPVTSPASRPVVALATYVGSTSATSVTVVPALPVAHPHVDVLADGSFLVVGARCRWQPAGPEQNALVIDQEGRIVRRGCLGDGIEHLQVASDGTIWVGYFDEGVFGNFGWGRPGPPPLGAGGIVAWSPELTKVWELDPDQGLVADCYALNVSSDAVFACPYTDFPVVRITHGQPLVLPTRGVSGPRGILASGDQVGLIGAYRDPWLMIRGRIRNDAFQEIDRTHLRAPDGSRLPQAQLLCRGSVAHLIAGTEWFTFDLAAE